MSESYYTIYWVLFHLKFNWHNLYISIFLIKNINLGDTYVATLKFYVFKILSLLKCWILTLIHDNQFQDSLYLRSCTVVISSFDITIEMFITANCAAVLMWYTQYWHLPDMWALFDFLCVTAQCTGNVFISPICLKAFM